MWQAYVAQLKSCSDFDTEHMSLLVKVQDRELIRALFAHLAAISKPQDGASRVLVLLAVVAKYATWLPDRLTVRCERLRFYVRITVQCRSGDVIERLWPSAMFRAPLEEFLALAEHHCNKKSFPLRLVREVEHGTVQTLILEMKGDVRKRETAKRDGQAFIGAFEQALKAPERPKAAPAKPTPQPSAIDTQEIDDDWE